MGNSLRQSVRATLRGESINGEPSAAAQPRMRRSGQRPSEERGRNY